MATPRPKNLADVREALCSMYSQVMDDRRMAPQVHEGANAMGKTISACKTHLMAAKLCGQQPDGDWKEFMLSNKSEPTPNEPSV